MDLEQVQKCCLQLPAVTEDVKWGYDLVFSVGGKMFCVVSTEPPYECSFKVPDEDFEAMAERPGFIPAPYMARAKWVQVTDLTNLMQKEGESLIKKSYQLVKTKLTKKLRTQLGVE